MHLVYPRKFCILFSVSPGYCSHFSVILPSLSLYLFLLDITVIPREILNIEKNFDAKFWGQTRCIMVYVKIVNQWISIMI